MPKHFLVYLQRRQLGLETYSHDSMYQLYNNRLRIQEDLFLLEDERFSVAIIEFFKKHNRVFSEIIKQVDTQNDYSYLLDYLSLNYFAYIDWPDLYDLKKDAVYRSFVLGQFKMIFISLFEREDLYQKGFSQADIIRIKQWIKHVSSSDSWIKNFLSLCKIIGVTQDELISKLCHLLTQIKFKEDELNGIAKLFLACGKELPNSVIPTAFAVPQVEILVNLPDDISEVYLLLESIAKSSVEAARPLAEKLLASQREAPIKIKAICLICILGDDKIFELFSVLAEEYIEEEWKKQIFYEGFGYHSPILLNITLELLTIAEIIGYLSEFKSDYFSRNHEIYTRPNYIKLIFDKLKLQQKNMLLAENPFGRMLYYTCVEENIEKAQKAKLALSQEPFQIMVHITVPEEKYIEVPFFRWKDIRDPVFFWKCFNKFKFVKKTSIFSLFPQRPSITFEYFPTSQRISREFIEYIKKRPCYTPFIELDKGQLPRPQIP